MQLNNSINYNIIKSGSFSSYWSFGYSYLTHETLTLYEQLQLTTSILLLSNTVTLRLLTFTLYLYLIFYVRNISGCNYIYSFTIYTHLDPTV